MARRTGVNDRLTAVVGRVDGLNKDIDGRLAALSDELRKENQRLEFERTKREKGGNVRLAALERRIDALNRDTDQDVKTHRRDVESKATISDVELLQRSLVRHGSVISAIGDDAKEMSRIATEILLGFKVVPSGHKVQSMRFESLTGWGGVISMLRSREAHEMADRQEGVEFHPHVILSQSERDLLGFMDPDSHDCYESSNGESHWMEFRFWRSLQIDGVRMTSDGIAFPRSFDICTGPGDSVVKSIQNADVNGTGRVLVVNFPEIMTDRLKIKQTGPNLEGSQYFLVQKIEFLSPDPEYPNGIFTNIVQSTSCKYSSIYSNSSS
jgi:hypothetical protein